MDKIKGFFLDFVLYNFLVVFSGIYLMCFFWVPCSNFHVKIVEKRQKCLSNSDNSGYSLDNQRDIDGLLHGMFVIHFWILKFIDFF